MTNTFHFRTKALLTMAALTLVSPAPTLAEEMLLTVQPLGATWLKGNSTLHRWSCVSRDIDGYFQAGISETDALRFLDQMDSALRQGRPPPLPDFTLAGPLRSGIQINARTFDGGNSFMERDMRRALKSDSFPAIVFIFERFCGIDARYSQDMERTEYHLKLCGKLSLASVTRDVELSLRAHRADAATLQIHAAASLKMSDFGISPPTAFFGMLQAHDELDVLMDFAITLKNFENAGGGN